MRFNTSLLQLNYRSHKEEIAIVVAQHLNGNFSDTLTRYSYLDEGAEIFLRLINNPDYLGYEREMKILEKIIPEISKQVSFPMHLIDLGPGNGYKAVKIMTILNNRIATYTALDISQTMLRIARNNQRNLVGICKIYKICDFTNISELKKQLPNNESSQSRFFLLLGNTLTNEVNPVLFLHLLRETIISMGDGRNYLLLGVECLTQDINQIVREYRNEEKGKIRF